MGDELYGGGVVKDYSTTYIFIIMEEALKKLIRKVILPKYYWIKDFDVQVRKKDDTGDSYRVLYFVDKDEHYERSVIDNIQNDTKELYDVLGLHKFDFYEGVMFFSYQSHKMQQSLEKLIGEVILPKYPWIKDFDVFGEDDFGEYIYSIHYYVDFDEYEKKDRNEITRIKSETKNLFNSLEPKENDFFRDIEFLNAREYNLNPK